jgi:uncharacterized low-complexity protein
VRTFWYVALLGALLLPVASASAHQGSAAKAKRALAKVIGGADTTQVGTGEVTVSKCRARRRGSHGHAFVCRVSVQQVYADGSHETCVDKSVRVLYREGKYRQVARSYLNPGGFTCSERVLPPSPPVPPSAPEVPAPVEPPAADAPPEQLPPPPPDAVPVGPPPGAPPFPFPFEQASAHTANATETVTARASQERSYRFVTWWPYHQYPQFPGVTWTIGQWAYTSLICNLYDDYYQWWWWGYNSVTGYNQWTYYGEMYAHKVYGSDTQYTSYPIC